MLEVIKIEINIEEKLPYTDILLDLMKTSLKNKKELTISNRLIKDVFQELGLK